MFDFYLVLTLFIVCIKYTWSGLQTEGYSVQTNDWYLYILIINDNANWLLLLIMLVSLKELRIGTY